MRSPRTRVPSRALRYLSLRATGGVFLQEARILPQLWRPPYGRDSGPSLGRGIPRCAIASVGDQFSVSSTVPVCRPLDRPNPGLERVAKANGFSLHAGVSCEGHQRDKWERLCRYIARPAVAIPRLSLSSTGKVVYTLKTPYRDGTTQVAFDPVDFIARLAALVPKPRVNLTRYHGVLAPNHRWRGLVTPAKRGKGAMRPVDSDVVSSIQRHAAMTWAQRLKRVFNIDIEVCSRCGGSVRVIACIEDQDVIDRILAHLRETEKEAPARPLLVPPTRAPPATLSLFAGTEFHQQGRH